MRTSVPKSKRVGRSKAFYKYIDKGELMHYVKPMFKIINLSCEISAYQVDDTLF